MLLHVHAVPEKIKEGNLNYNKKKLYIPINNPEMGMCQRCKTIFFHSSKELKFSLIYKSKVAHNFKLDKLSNDPGDRYGLWYYNTRQTNHEQLKESLVKRHSGRVYNLIDVLGIKGDKDSIIFPFKVNNELVYWQERFFNPKPDEPKYFMPPISHKPIYIPYVRSRIVMIVEGVFDALACLYLFPNVTPVALLGSYVTDYHIWLLRNFIAPKFVIAYMDEESISYGVLMKLSGNLPTCIGYDIRYPMSGTDPDEFLGSLTSEELKSFKSSNDYGNKFRL